MQHILEKHISIKVNVEFFGMYVIFSKNVMDVKSFNTKNSVVTQATALKEVYDQFMATILGKASEFQERDSGKKSCLSTSECN